MRESLIDDKVVGARIREIRKGLKKNQIEFSNLVNIKQSNLSEIETGKRSVPIDVLKRLSQSDINVNLNFIFSGLYPKFLTQAVTTSEESKHETNYNPMDDNYERRLHDLEATVKAILKKLEAMEQQNNTRSAEENEAKKETKKS